MIRRCLEPIFLKCMNLKAVKKSSDRPDIVRIRRCGRSGRVLALQRSRVQVTVQPTAEIAFLTQTLPELNDMVSELRAMTSSTRAEVTCLPPKRGVHGEEAVIDTHYDAC
jgi:hypothetical protein